MRDFLWEWPENDRVEVHRLILHVLKDPVERHVIVLFQCQFEECLVFLEWLAFCEFVTEEAVEELDVAHLTLNGESLRIPGTLHIVMPNCLLMCIEHLDVDEEGAYHSTSPTFACLAMNNDGGLHFCFRAWILEGILSTV